MKPDFKSLSSTTPPSIVLYCTVPNTSPLILHYIHSYCTSHFCPVLCFHHHFLTSASPWLTVEPTDSSADKQGALAFMSTKKTPNSLVVLSTPGAPSSASAAASASDGAVAATVDAAAAGEQEGADCSHILISIYLILLPSSCVPLPLSTSDSCLSVIYPLIHTPLESPCLFLFNLHPPYCMHVSLLPAVSGKSTRRRTIEAPATLPATATATSTAPQYNQSDAIHSSSSAASVPLTAPTPGDD